MIRSEFLTPRIFLGPMRWPLRFAPSDRRSQWIVGLMIRTPPPAFLLLRNGCPPGSPGALQALSLMFEVLLLLGATAFLPSFGSISPGLRVMFLMSFTWTLTPYSFFRHVVLAPWDCVSRDIKSPIYPREVAGRLGLILPPFLFSFSWSVSRLQPFLEMHWHGVTSL